MNINVKYFNTFGYLPNYGKLQPSIRKIKNFKDLTFTIFYAILIMMILPLEGGPYIGHRRDQSGIVFVRFQSCLSVCRYEYTVSRAKQEIRMRGVRMSGTIHQNVWLYLQERRSNTPTFACRLNGKCKALQKKISRFLASILIFIFEF